MNATAHLLLAAVAFLAAHFIASTPLRAGLIAGVGQRAYLALFSAVALVTLIWMVWAYQQAPLEPLWPGLRAAPLLLMPLSLVLLVAGYFASNPTAVMQEGKLRLAEPARGIVRITRHPIMWAIALWATAHVLARGNLKSLIFFGAFLVLALAGTVLIDRRRASLGEDWRRFVAVTSNVPFAAIVQGRNRLAAGEIGGRKLLVALALFVALFLLHPYIFGARPY